MLRWKSTRTGVNEFTHFDKPPHAIAIDLDGTLLDSQNRLSALAVREPASKRHYYSSGNVETSKNYAQPDASSTQVLGIKRQKRRYYANT